MRMSRPPDDGGAISANGPAGRSSPAAVADGALRVGALMDIKRRPASQMRGRKRVWAAAIALVSCVGVVPISYFVFGRRRHPDSTPASEAEGQVVRTCLPAHPNGRAVSLIPSLIHVRVPGSITVYDRALSRVDGPAWPVLDNHP